MHLVGMSLMLLPTLGTSTNAGSFQVSTILESLGSLRGRLRWRYVADPPRIEIGANSARPVETG
jgi:hypothetical protein